MISRIKVIQSTKKKNQKSTFNEVWSRFIEITKSITYSIVLDLTPINSSEMHDLQSVLKIIEPFYQFPTEKQLLEVIIPKMYDQVKKKMSSTINNDLLKGINSITLTIDGWVGRSITDYMTITMHYWTIDFEPRHFLLQFESLPKTWNTSQDLFHLIQNVLLRYGLLKNKDTTIYIVTANGNNIVKAVSTNDKWIRIPCFARLLQMTVDDVLRDFDDFNNLISKCLLLVSKLWSKTSTETKDHGKSCIIDDVIPSWISIFEMFDNLLKLRTTIHLLLDESSTSEKLSESDWKTISSYVQIFSLLKQTGDCFSKEEYPSLSLYLPTIRGILEMMETMDLNDQLSSQLIRSICSRFRHINTNEAMIISMVVDPRFKTRLLSEDETYTVFDIVKNKMLFENVDTEDNETVKIKNDTSTSLKSYFIHIEQKGHLENSIEKIADAELTFYLCETVAPIETVISDWWKDNSKRFPKLCKLARDYLCIPAVQVSTEKAFPKKAGYTADTRAEILTDKVNVLDLMRISFLNQNLKQFDVDISL